MNNILIFGHNSFIAKNFIKNHSHKFNLFFFRIYFKNKKTFEKKLFYFIKKNNIKTIINFAANNDNNSKNNNFKKILSSNFDLPISLINISNITKTTVFLFLSQDSSDSKYLQNFYSLSKNMLNYYLTSKTIKTKLRIFNIESTFGPGDNNIKRLIPSLMMKLDNHKTKINLHQKKKLLYVKDLNKEIVKLFKSKKIIIYKNLKGKKYDINKIYKILKIFKKNKIQYKKYNKFYETFNWYKKYY